MRNIILLLWAILLLLPLTAFAEIKTITHTVQQPFGGSQSPDDARTAGIARAKREALERFGTYIESSTVVKNSQVDSDEILALTAGVTKAEVVKQKNYTDGDGFGLEITVKVELDTAVLDQSLKRLLQDRNHLKDLTDARQREKQLLARIAELEKQNKQKGKSERQKEDLKKEFQKTRDGLTAVEWFDKAAALWDGEKYTNALKAVEHLTQAIKLNSYFYGAYNNRGLAYANLKNYKKSIKDYDKALKLRPDDAVILFNRGNTYADHQQYQNAINDFSLAISVTPKNAHLYTNRGSAYAKLQKYSKAINDFNQAITLDPNEAKAYNNRGGVYANMKSYQIAIVDFNNAIHIDQHYAFAYYNRGYANSHIEQHHQAILDYSKALELDPNLKTIYRNRGVSYAETKQYQNAINDFTKAISLEPQAPVTYRNRGFAFIDLGDYKAGCRDLKKACSLGDCEGYDVARQEGSCN